MLPVVVACGLRFSQLASGAPLPVGMTSTGTEWKIGWLPLGGYVKFFGDENESQRARC